MTELRNIVERLRDHEISRHHGGCADCYGMVMDDAASEIESLRSQLATAEAAYLQFRSGYEARLAKATAALTSVSHQCGNVIFNCEQRPAGNQRHLDSWKSVKEYADLALEGLTK